MVKGIENALGWVGNAKHGLARKFASLMAKEIAINLTESLDKCH